MSVTLIYDFRAKDGRGDELLPLLIGGRDFGRTVEGCQAFEVFRGRDDSSRFVMLETWESAEAQKAHFEANVMPSGVLEKVAALIEADVQPTIFESQ